MAKRRRGARTARPRAPDHRPFEELVERALARSRAVRGRPRRGRHRHRRRADRRPAARERARPGRDAVRPVRGRAADRVGRRLGRRSRTGSRSSGCRSRRTSPIRTTSPTRSGSRSSTSSPTTSASTTTGSTSSASTDRARRAQADGDRTAERRRARRRRTRASIGQRQPAERPAPGSAVGRVAIAARADVVEPDVARVRPTNMTTCGASEMASDRVDQRAEREDPDDDPDRRSGPGRPARNRRRGRGRRRRAGRCRARRRARGRRAGRRRSRRPRRAAAASLRARKTRNDRRVASNGSTSPRTTPASTYANGAPTSAATRVEVTSETLRLPGPRRRRATPLTRLCAMSTGMPTMIDGDDRGQNTIRDRARACAHVDRPMRIAGRRGWPIAIVRLSTVATSRPSTASDAEQPEPAPTPDVEERARYSRRVRWTETTSSARLAERERPDGPEHDRADVERRPAHLVGRAGRGGRSSRRSARRGRLDGAGRSAASGAAASATVGRAAVDSARVGRRSGSAGRVGRLRAGPSVTRVGAGQRPGGREQLARAGRPRRCRPTATTATRSPSRIGIRPARTAASAAAPAGSTTCFIRSSANRMPGQDRRVVEQHDPVEVAPAHRQRPRPGERRAQAVGDALRLDP